MVKVKYIVVLMSIILCLVINLPVYADTQRIQMPGSGLDSLGCENVTNSWYRLGQRLTIPNRLITSIGYQVRRVGNATGNVSITIRDVETDDIILGGVWGDASELPDVSVSGYREITLDKPVRVDGDVRICVEYYGGNATNYCVAAYYTGDKITGEWYCNYLHDGRWHKIGEAEEGSYCYTYIVEDEPEPNGNAAGGVNTTMLAVIGGLVVCILGIGYLVRNKKRNA